MNNFDLKKYLVENKLTAGSRLNENKLFTPEDDINFKWKNQPANPKGMLTDTKSGEKFTKEEFWESDIIGTDPSLIFPNYGNENSDGTWTLTFDEGELSGFIEGEDFILSKYNLKETQPAPAQPKPDTETIPGTKPTTPKRRTLTPPDPNKVPETRPKAVKEGDDEIVQKIVAKYKELKK